MTKTNTFRCAFRRSRLVFAGVAAALAACPGAPPEEAREPVIRFAARSTHVTWDEMPTTPEARRAESQKRAAEAARLSTAGDALAAVIELRRAVDLTPGDVDLRTQLARAFAALKDEDAALRILREGLKILPDHAGALFESGRLLEATASRRTAAELAVAVASWKRVLELSPKSEEAAKVRVGLRALEKLAADAAAKAAAQEKSAEPPKPPPESPAPPRAPEKREAPSRDLPRARIPPPAPAQAAAGAAFDAEDALLAGNALVERGQLAEAVRAYERALREQPGHREARWMLGVAHERAGDLRAALAAWKPLADAKALDGARRQRYEAARARARALK